MADEEIRIEILVQAQKSIQETVRLRKQMEELKSEARVVAKATGESFDKVFASIKRVRLDDLREDLANFSAQLKEMTAGEEGFGPLESRIRSIKREISDLGEASSFAFREMKDGSKQAEGGIQGFINNLGELGTIGKFVFGTVFGLGAIEALRRVIDLFKEAIQASLDFQRSIFTLEVAIRGLQRVGLDTSIDGWNRRLEELKRQFPIFSKKEFTDAASLAALMTREFGFTEAQIADLVKQSAILSEITGKDLNEAVRGVTFAIGSGYFESLQRAGINISRQVVANKALELGYEGVYNELEPVIRASITYAVIQDNLNAIQEDAGRIVDTTAGQVARLRARWEDLLIALGKTVTQTEGAKGAISELADAVEALTELVNLLSPEYDNLATTLARNVALFGPITGATKTLINFLQSQGESAIDSITEKFESWGFSIERVSQNLIQLQKNFGLITEPILGDLVDEDAAEALEKFEIGGVEFSEEEHQEIVDATVELAEEIEKIEEESFKKRQDALDKFQDDSADKFRNHIDKIIDIQQDLNRRLADITLKAEQRTADAIASNAFRVQEAIRKAAFRREDAERKFRERQISAERKFQEKLRQLRENFLLDLEDAVRERDARQIIRLTRQFNLRRTQMVREEKLNKTDREAQFQEELKQIERQKQERLRQLAVEHQRRLEDIARQAERERAQARIDAERRKEEENIRFEREKADRKERQDEILNAIEEEKQERITAFIAGLQEQYGLTKEQLDAFSLLWKNIFGPDGEIVEWVETGVAEVEARMLQLERFMNRLQTMMGTIPPELQGIRTEKEFQPTIDYRDIDKARDEEKRKQSQAFDEEDRLAEEQEEDRKARRVTEKENLTAWIAERLGLILGGIQEESDSSETKLSGIGNIWENVYGPSGRVDNSIQYAIQRIIQLISIMRLLRQEELMSSQLSSARQQTVSDFYYAGRQAEGGTIVAKKPTVAIFGEAGPEMAQFTPLNNLGSNGKAAITPMDAGNMSRDGRIKLEMLLSPDLEARVVDNTLGEIADINFAIERARK